MFDWVLNTALSHPIVFINISVEELLASLNAFSIVNVCRSLQKNIISAIILNLTLLDTDDRDNKKRLLKNKKRYSIYLKLKKVRTFEKTLSPSTIDKKIA